MDIDDVWRTVEEQRLDVARMLEGLDAGAWDTPSLCAGWRVREVAAHITLAAGARPLSAMVGVVRAGGNFNRYVRDDAAHRATRSPQQLIADIREIAASRHHPPTTKPADPLVDILVHGQDIAVPLGIERTMPTEAAIAAADRVWSMGFPFNARRRLAGKHLRATNADWSRGGDGAATADVVEAPIEQILLLLTGRRA